MFLTVLAVQAAPVIDRHGVRHAATGQRATATEGALAPGSAFTVRGAGFQPGSSIEIVAARAMTAEVLAITPALIRARLPLDLPNGYATLRVRSGGQSSAPVRIRVVPMAVGLYGPFTGGLGKPETVKPGEKITLRGTGWGAEPERYPVDVFVGGSKGQVLSARRDSKTGDDLIVLRVPDSAPKGCFVPVVVRGAGRVSNTVSLSIDTPAETCGQRESTRTAVCGRARAGFIMPYRLSFRYDVNESLYQDSVGEILSAGFWDGTSAAFCRLAAPSTDGCSVFPDLSMIMSDFDRAVEEGTRRLEAGTFRIGPAVVEAPNPQLGQHLYHTLISGTAPGREEARGPLFLRPGLVEVRAGGGTDVPAFQLKLRFPEPIEWLDRSSISSIDRSRALTLGWKGDRGSQVVLIVGLTVQESSRSMSAFVCRAAAGTSSFTIPDYALQVLPPTRNRRHGSYGLLLLATMPEDPLISLGAYGGLDALLATGLAVDGRTVVYR